MCFYTLGCERCVESTPLLIALDRGTQRPYDQKSNNRVAVISAKNHKRQRRKRQSQTAKREKSQTPKVLTAILFLPNLT